MHPRACRGNSDFDTTHYITSDVTYALPFGHGRKFGATLPRFADELWTVYSDPEVARYVGGDLLNAESTREQTERWASFWDNHGYGQSAVISRETGQLLGRIGLSFWPDWNETELGYVLSRTAQGCGLAAEGTRAWINWATTNLPTTT